MIRAYQNRLCGADSMLCIMCEMERRPALDYATIPQYGKVHVEGDFAKRYNHPEIR